MASPAPDPGFLENMPKWIHGHKASLSDYALAFAFYPLALKLSGALLRRLGTGRATKRYDALAPSQLFMIGGLKRMLLGSAQWRMKDLVESKATKTTNDGWKKAKTFARRSQRKIMQASDLLLWMGVIWNQYGKFLNPHDVYVILFAFFMTRLTLTLLHNIVLCAEDAYREKSAKTKFPQRARNLVGLWAVAAFVGSAVLFGVKQLNPGKAKISLGALRTHFYWERDVVSADMLSLAALFVSLTEAYNDELALARVEKSEEEPDFSASVRRMAGAAAQNMKPALTIAGNYAFFHSMMNVSVYGFRPQLPAVQKIGAALMATLASTHILHTFMPLIQGELGKMVQ